MRDWMEEMFEPIRRKSREANAPLLAKLDVSAAELERLASIVAARPDLPPPEVKRAVGMTALRGATRL
jgi:hypothetical protein